MPADLTAGWALVLMSASAHQIDAAKQDSARVIVCPRIHSNTALDPAIIAAYASCGATAGMTLRALLDLLIGVEPAFDIA
jgi:hypothetical protein